MHRRQKRGAIAKKRILQMLELGTEPHELGRCLHESRKLLIAAGAKADNLPTGLKKQVEFVESLSPKAEDVVCSWFKENADFTDCDETTSAIHKLLTEPNCKDRSIWRPVLRAFVLSDCEPPVERWLRGEPEVLDQPIAVETATTENGLAPEDIVLCLSIAKGEQLVELQRPMPMLMAGAIAAARGDVEAAKTWMFALKSYDEPKGTKLAEIIGAALRQYVPALTPHQAEPLTNSMVTDIDHLPFIGIVKRVLPSGQLFVSVIALKVDGAFYEVTPLLAKQLFPETGDATIFPSTVQKQFAEGEIGLWAAVRGSAEHTTRCVVERSFPQPFLPVRVPHPSSEPDAVREWMLQVYKPSPLHQPLFTFSDGLAIRLPSGHYDPSRVDFDTPFDGYRNVQWIELVGAGVSFVADLPADTEKIDLSPPSTLVRRLFRVLKDSEIAPTLTKHEIQALSELASINQPELASWSRRAVDGLWKTTDAKSLLQDASTELLAIPAIKEIIEAEKRNIAATHAKQMEQANQALQDVAKKKQALANELENLRNSIRKETAQHKQLVKQQETELVRKLRSAFEKASQEGAEALSQAAVIRAILPIGGLGETDKKTLSTAAANNTAASTSTSAIPTLVCGPIVDSIRALRRTVETRAELSGLNEILLASAIAAARSSPVIGIVGENTSPLIQTLTDVLTNGTRCRTSIFQDMFNIGDLMRSPAVIQQAGNTWATTVGEHLVTTAEIGIPSVIELRGSNRAPLEALLPELLDCGPNQTGISWQDSTGKLRHAASRGPVIWILTFADGKTVFPIPEGLASSVPLLSTDGWLNKPKQTNSDSPVSTSISKKCWTDLGPPGEDTHPTVDLCSLRAAAQALGLEDEAAGAFEHLALSAGRHGHVKAIAVAKQLGGVVSTYAESLERSSGTLQKLFGIEGA
jgi:hypothetical protein